ncbi:ARM repeat-containing protein [Neoconidiobolus thromboides FSU 785]|nr:ARM repeat-containing protein [Neoconidiobolus thromboides FSU 785]
MAEELIQRYILSFDSNRDDTEVILKEIINEFSNTTLTFSGFIKYLQEYLISEDSNLRSKGISLLSDILKNIDDDLITLNEVQAFNQFFIQRFQDKYCITEILKGVSSLQKLKSKFGYNEAYDLLKNLFKYIHVQELNQSLRLECFYILDRVIKDFPTIPNSMQDEFFKGLIEAVDGEKDPRNLIIVFNLVKHVITNYNIGKFSKDFFDITFCYFPITFKAPKDDPFSISPITLKEELRQILSATFYFDEFALPSILDKLSSSSPNAKKDSLNLLLSALPVYRLNSILNNVTSLVKNLLEEIYHPIDEDIQNLSLKVVQELFINIYKKDPKFMNNLKVQDSITLYLNEVKVNLKSDDVKIINSTGLAIKAISESNSEICFYFGKILLHLIIDFYKKAELVTKRKALVECIVNLLESYKSVLINPTLLSKLPNNDAIFYCKDVLLQEFSKTLSTKGEFVGIQKNSIKGLIECIIIPDLLSIEEKQYYTQIIVSYLLNIEDEMIKDEILEYLMELNKALPEVVLNVVLPMLFSHFPKSSQDLKMIPVDKFRSNLSSLIKLSSEPSAFNVIVKEIFYVIDIIGKEENILYVDYLVKALEILLNILEACDISTTINGDLMVLLNGVIVPIIYKCLSFSLSIQAPIICHPTAVNIIKHILIVTIRILNIPLQQQILNESYKLYFNVKDKGLFFGDNTSSEFANFNPFTNPGTPSQTILCNLFLSILIACHKEVLNWSITTESLLLDLLELSFSSKDYTQFHSCCQIISIILNKRFKDDKLSEFVKENFVNKITFELRNKSNDINKRKMSLELILWGCKALIIQSEKFGFELLELLVQFLDDNDLGSNVSEAIDQIFEEDKWFFAKQNHSIIKLLYKQRSFSLLLPKLTKGFLEANSEEIKHNFLIAISSLLIHIPKQILLRDGVTLLPLLLSALDHFIPQIQISTLKTLTLILQESNALIIEIYSTLLPKLLLLVLPYHPIKNDKSIPIQVRIEAINCLGEFPHHLPAELLLPSQFEVTKALIPALDDPKRIVRAKVVCCRNRWLSFSAKA